MASMLTGKKNIMQCTHQCPVCGYTWDCAFPRYEEMTVKEALSEGFKCIAEGDPDAPCYCNEVSGGYGRHLKFTAQSYDGTKTGNSGYNHKRGVQIVATDETGTRRKVFTIEGRFRTYKSECLKLWEGTAHYKSGLNKRDAAEFVAAMEEAKKLAAKMNETQYPDLRE